jgi:hypothetical protein
LELGAAVPATADAAVAGRAGRAGTPAPPELGRVAEAAWLPAELDAAVVALAPLAALSGDVLVAAESEHATLHNASAVVVATQIGMLIDQNLERRDG